MGRGRNGRKKRKKKEEKEEEEEEEVEQEAEEERLKWSLELSEIEPRHLIYPSRRQSKQMLNAD